MPAQKSVADRGDPNYFIVKFNDRDARNFVIRDISTGSKMNWTFAHPEMQFPVEPHPNLRFVMHLWMSGNTLKQTGPVTIRVQINGRPVGEIHCSQDIEYWFDKPVPQEWLRSGEPVRVLAEADRLWTSPRDGVRLGYLIEQAGFRW